MKYYKIPKEYLFLLLLFFLTIFSPFYLLAIKSEFRWWAMNFGLIKNPLLLTFFCFVFFSITLLKFPEWGKRWFVFYSFNLILFFILEINKTPTATMLVFFVLFLAFLFKTYQYIMIYLKTPSVHLGLRWYHGLFSFSPHLQTEFHIGDRIIPFKTSSLSSDGLAGILENFDNQTTIESKKDLSIQLKFKESVIKIRSQLICSLQNKLSSHSLIFGLKFNRLKPDEEKDLSDFLEILRGEGYEC